MNHRHMVAVQRNCIRSGSSFGCHVSLTVLMLDMIRFGVVRGRRNTGRWKLANWCDERLRPHPSVLIAHPGHRAVVAETKVRSPPKGRALVNPEMHGVLEISANPKSIMINDRFIFAAGINRPRPGFWNASKLQPFNIPLRSHKSPHIECAREFRKCLRLNLP